MIPKASGAITTGIDKIGSAIKTAFTVTSILAIIGAVIEFGKKLIDITGISEKYQNQFTCLFEGNGAAAKGYLSSLQNVADTTPTSPLTIWPITSVRSPAGALF